MSHDEDLKVVDKRRFTTAGEVKDPAVDEVPRGSPSQPSPPAGSQAPTALPPLSFSHFCLSLATSIQMGLGLIPNPATGKPEQDLPMARQTIDLLGLLQEKTKGNLSKDEAGLLEELLYTVRMQCCEIEKSKKG